MGQCSPLAPRVDSDSRSESTTFGEPATPVALLDTFGELTALWGLADVAFVGGSLDGKRGGQNMIEPASYGAAVLFGPHTWNFRDTVERLLAVNGAVRIEDGAMLERAVARLLGDAEVRERLGAAGVRVRRVAAGDTADRGSLRPIAARRRCVRAACGIANEPWPASLQPLCFNKAG